MTTNKELTTKALKHRNQTNTLYAQTHVASNQKKNHEIMEI